MNNQIAIDDTIAIPKIRPKALLIAVNSRGDFLIQDRAGHKPPAWGFFGGGIEEGETPTQAVIRETKEELDIDITADDVVYMGSVRHESPERIIIRHWFLYQTEQTDFTVYEGAGAYWLSQDEARDRLVNHDDFEELCTRVQQTKKDDVYIEQ